MFTITLNGQTQQVDAAQLSAHLAQGWTLVQSTPSAELVASIAARIASGDSSAISDDIDFVTRQAIERELQVSHGLNVGESTMSVPREIVDFLVSQNLTVSEFPCIITSNSLPRNSANTTRKRKDGSNVGTPFWVVSFQTTVNGKNYEKECLAPSKAFAKGQAAKIRFEQSKTRKVRNSDEFAWGATIVL